MENRFNKSIVLAQGGKLLCVDVDAWFYSSELFEQGLGYLSDKDICGLKGILKDHEDVTFEHVAQELYDIQCGLDCETWEEDDPDQA